MQSSTINDLNGSNLLYLNLSSNNSSLNDKTKELFSKTFYVTSIDSFKEKLENKFIDFVIIDIDDSCDLDILKKVKNKNKNIPIVILCEFTNKEFIIRLVNKDYEEVLFKPFCEDILADKITKHISQYLANIKYHQNLKLLEQYQLVTDKSTIISKTDKKGMITYVNDNFCLTSGYEREELIGKSHNIVRHPDNPKELYEEIWNTIKNKKEDWHGIIKNITKDGNTYYVKSTIKPIFDKYGEIKEFIALRDDITEIMSDKKQLLDEIDSNHLSMLILIQIENYDTLDKFYDDKVVENIEELFKDNVHNYFEENSDFDRVYHLGHGRYALVKDFFACNASQEELEKSLKKFIKNVKNSTLVVDEIDYDLEVIISYAYGRDKVFEDAKYGIEKAIELKQSIIHANDLSIQEQVQASKNMETIKMIKVALENYKIISYFQPIINNKTKEVEKFESLVRLIDENENVISPFFFLDASKKGDYYTQITDRVLENSFKVLEYLENDISINISAIDIEKKRTREKLYTLLEKYSQYSNRVVFELLEDENVKDFETIKEFIHNVKKRGVKIAIDDFGAGYSNFERLLDYDPDIVKIDGSLVKNIESDKFSRDVIETISVFAKKQNIKTIAEYVENESIYNILKDIGIDYSQGYYFGKPKRIEIPVS